MKQKNMRLAGILACLLALSCAGCGVQGGLPDGSAAGEPQQSAGETSAAGAAQEAGKNGAVPQASNGYLVSQEMGRQVDIDLDGDGTADTLQVSVRQVERGEGENTWTESVLDSIVINGKEQAATGKSPGGLSGIFGKPGQGSLLYHGSGHRRQGAGDRSAGLRPQR